MAPKILTAASVPAAADIVVQPVTTELSTPKMIRSSMPTVADALLAQGFAGRADQVVVVQGGKGRAIVYIGVGPAATVDADRCRRLGAQAARAAKHSARLAVDVRELITEAEPTERVEFARALAEGLVLGSYRYTEFRSKTPKPTLGSATVVMRGSSRLKAAVAEGAAIAAAQNLARDLVNRPAAPSPRPHWPMRHAGSLDGRDSPSRCWVAPRSSGCVSVASWE
mgnify:CR=1 FL=1